MNRNKQARGLEISPFLSLILPVKPILVRLSMLVVLRAGEKETGLKIEESN